VTSRLAILFAVRAAFFDSAATMVAAASRVWSLS